MSGLSDADRRVLKALSSGPKSAQTIGEQCFAPPTERRVKELRRFTIVASRQLALLAGKGMVTRSDRGGGKIEWTLASPSEGELF